MFPATLRHVLVPLDFSEPSDRALEVAIELARPSGARLTLLHTLMPPVTSDVGFGLGDTLALMESDAQAKMAVRVARVEGACEAIVRIGAPAIEIVAYLEQHPLDLVVMSTHGRTGLTHVVMGSVAERVLQRSRCPVLVLPRHLDGRAIAP